MSYPLLVAVEVCPTCSRTGRSFTCTSCLEKGDFVHSSGKGKSFSENKETLLARWENRSKSFKRIEKWKEAQCEVHNKTSEIVVLKNRIENLKQAISIARDYYNKDCHELSVRKENYAKRLKMLKNAKKQFEDIKERHMPAQKVEDLDRLQSKLNGLRSDLIDQRKRSVRALVTDIFPIATRPVYPEFGTPPRATISTQVSIGDVILERSMTAESELEEATMTSYVEGQWISRKETEETEHCIVETGLPTSGDYMRYFEWLKSHRNETRDPESGGSYHFNSTLSIPAALAYTAQLVHTLSIILDVQLPRNATYNEFCHPEITRRKFFEAVNALNANVVHLCHSQLVPTDDISPMQVLKNVEICISCDNLGWIGAFETFPFTLPDCPFDSDSSVEELAFDSDSGGDAKEKEEWDELADLRDVPKSMSDLHQVVRENTSSESSLSQSASGLVTSAAASVAAFWPWKKQK